jgi:TolA-binding protein
VQKRELSPVERGKPAAELPEDEDSSDSEVDGASTSKPGVVALRPAELSFKSGYEAYRLKDYDRAARDLQRALQEEGASNIAVDARYWRIVALVRAGNDAAAEAAMREFLGLHSGSARAPEISAMLGWRLVKSDPAAARPLFEAATKSPDSKVAESGRKGLQLVLQADK